MPRLTIVIDIHNQDPPTEDPNEVAETILHPDIAPFSPGETFVLDWCCAEGQVDGQFVSAEWTP